MEPLGSTSPSRTGAHDPPSRTPAHPQEALALLLGDGSNRLRAANATIGTTEAFHRVSVFGGFRIPLEKPAEAKEVQALPSGMAARTRF
jgi:hypothetical protein